MQNVKELVEKDAVLAKEDRRRGRWLQVCWWLLLLAASGVVIAGYIAR